MLRFIVSIFFPPFVYLKRFNSPSELWSPDRVNAVLSSLAKEKIISSPEGNEYVLSERKFYPYAPLMFGVVRIATVTADSGSFSVRMVLSTQRALNYIFCVVFYGMNVWGYTFQDESAKQSATMLAGAVLITNIQGRVFAGWYHWGRLEKLLESAPQK